jgi:hypothetical protein
VTETKEDNWNVQVIIVHISYFRRGSLATSY